MTNVLEVILHNHFSGRYLSNMIISRQCISSSAWKGVWMSKHCSMVAQASASGSTYGAGQHIVSKAINMGAPFVPTSCHNCLKEDPKFLHMEAKTQSKLRDALDEDLRMRKLPKLPLSARNFKRNVGSPGGSPRRQRPATTRGVASTSKSGTPPSKNASPKSESAKVPTPKDNERSVTMRSPRPPPKSAMKQSSLQRHAAQAGEDHYMKMHVARKLTQANDSYSLRAARNEVMEKKKLVDEYYTTLEEQAGHLTIAPSSPSQSKSPQSNSKASPNSYASPRVGTRKKVGLAKMNLYLSSDSLSLSSPPSSPRTVIGSNSSPRTNFTTSNIKNFSTSPAKFMSPDQRAACLAHKNLFSSSDSWMDRVHDYEHDELVDAKVNEVLDEYDAIAKELTRPSFDVKTPISLYEVRDICNREDAVEVIKMLKERDGEWKPPHPTEKQQRDEKLRGAKALHCSILKFVFVHFSCPTEAFCLSFDHLIQHNLSTVIILFSPTRFQKEARSAHTQADKGISIRASSCRLIRRCFSLFSLLSF